MEETYGNKRIYINTRDLDTGVDDLLNRYIDKGKVGIYTDLDDRVYYVLQNKICLLGTTISQKE